MSVFAKIVTGIFGKKSEKDLKELSPFVDEINASYNTLGSLTDDELINQFHTIKEEIKDLSTNSRKTFKAEGLEEEALDDAVIKAEQEFLDLKMPEVFAIVKDASRRICGTEFIVMHQKMKIWLFLPIKQQ